MIYVLLFFLIFGCLSPIVSPESFLPKEKPLPFPILRFTDNESVENATYILCYFRGWNEENGQKVLVEGNLYFNKRKNASFSSLITNLTSDQYQLGIASASIFLNGTNYIYMPLSQECDWVVMRKEELKGQVNTIFPNVSEANSSQNFVIYCKREKRDDLLLPNGTVCIVENDEVKKIEMRP